MTYDLVEDLLSLYRGVRAGVLTALAALAALAAAIVRAARRADKLLQFQRPRLLFFRLLPLLRLPLLPLTPRPLPLRLGLSPILQLYRHLLLRPDLGLGDLLAVSHRACCSTSMSSVEGSCYRVNIMVSV